MSSKQLNRVAVRVLAPLAATVLFLTGCSTSSPPPDSGASTPSDAGTPATGMEELIKAAQEEGEIQVYTGADGNAAVRWLQGFTDKYGIDVLTFSSGTAGVWQRFTQESQTNAHQADIIIDNDAIRYQEADEKGWIADYTPASDSRYPDELKRSGRWYGLYVSADPIGYNADKITPEEEQLLFSEEYAALADPRFDGRIGISVPNTGRNFRTWYRLGVLDKDLGDPFLEQVAANSPDLFTSGSALTEQLVAGEYAVAVGVADTQIIRAALKGANVKMIYPHPATGTSFSMAINSGAPSPNAARLFMEWATSEEGLASASVEFDVAPPYDGVTDGRDLSSLDWFKAPEEVEYGWEFEPTMLADQDDFVQHWNSLFGFAG